MQYHRLDRFLARALILPVSLTMALSVSLESASAGPAGAAPLIGRYGPVERAEGPGRPALLLGPLSAEAPGVEPAVVAGRFLGEMRRAPDAQHLVPREMGTAEVAPVGVGHVVRLPQRHRGIPVLGGEMILRITQSGQVVRALSAVVPAEDLDAIDTAPTVSAEGAVAAVWARRGAPIPERRRSRRSISIV